MARYLARTCSLLGRFERAETYLRTASGVAAEPGFGALAPLVDREWALYDEARGRLDEARGRLREARRCRAVQSAHRHRCLGAPSLRSAAARAALGEPGLASYGALRAAERALDRGDAAAAHAAAVAAERRFEEAGVLHETLRARLCRAEALVALGRAADGERVAAACGRTAARLELPPLELVAALVVAAAAARDGRLGDRAAALARAEPLAASLPAGVAARALARLGLDRAPAHVVTLGERAWLVAAAAEPPVDPTCSWISTAPSSSAASNSWPAQRLQLVALLAGGRRRRVLSLEEMYFALWSGREYHPLNHRNMVYVALQRMRAALKALVGSEPLARVGDGRYRLADRVRIGVRRRAEPDVLARLTAAAPRAADAAAAPVPPAS